MYLHETKSFVNNQEQSFSVYSYVVSFAVLTLKHAFNNSISAFTLKIAGSSADFSYCFKGLGESTICTVPGCAHCSNVFLTLICDCLRFTGEATVRDRILA